MPGVTVREHLGAKALPDAPLEDPVAEPHYETGA